MRTLVLGASGLAGSHLVERFRGLGEVHGTFHSNVRPGLLPLDVRDVDAVRALVGRVRPDVVVIAAAEPFVEQCERDPAGTRAVNVDGTRNVVGAAQEQGSRLVYFSSDYVFDGTRAPYREDDAVHPINEYGRQKVNAERLVLDVPGSLVCRTSALFGWHPLRKNYVCQVIDALRAGREMRAATDQVLCPTWVHDLAIAVTALVQRTASGVVHIAGRDALARDAFARLVAEAFSLDARLVRGVTTEELRLAAPRPRNTALANDRLTSLTGLLMTPTHKALAAMRKNEQR